MTLDIPIILGLIKRKSVSWFGAAVVGAWVVIAFPDFQAWVKQGLDVIGPVGVLALISSIVMSTKNEVEGVKDVEAAQNRASAPGGQNDVQV